MPTKRQKPVSLNRVLVTLAALIIVILGIRFIATDLIAPLLMAFFLTALMRPFFNWFRRKGYSSITSVVLMLTSIIVGLIGVILITTWCIDILREALAPLTESLKQSIETLPIDSDTAEEIAKTVDPNAILNLIWSLVGNLQFIILYGFIIPSLSIMLLLQLDSMPKDMLSGLTKQSPFLNKISHFASSIVLYVGGRFKVNLISAIMLTSVLLILNVDYPFLWGFMSLILGFVPYIGAFLSGLFPTLIAYTQYGWGVALLVIVALGVIGFVTENIIDPKIQGERNRISTATMVAALIFWSWLLGPIGAILSAPLTYLIKIVLADYPETLWISQFMEGNYKASKKKIAQQGNFKRFTKKARALIRI